MSLCTGNWTDESITDSKKCFPFFKEVVKLKYRNIRFPLKVTKEEVL